MKLVTESVLFAFGNTLFFYTEVGWVANKAAT